MLRQLVLRMEEEVARQTDVRAILLVDAAHVLLQVRKLQERGRTQLALERFLARVQPDVQFQRCRVRKGLLANFAFVRTFTRVCPHVNFQLRPAINAIVPLKQFESTLLQLLDEIKKEEDL